MANQVNANQRIIALLHEVLRSLGISHKKLKEEASDSEVLSALDEYMHAIRRLRQGRGTPGQAAKLRASASYYIYDQLSHAVRRLKYLGEESSPVVAMEILEARDLTLFLFEEIGSLLDGIVEVKELILDMQDEELKQEVSMRLASLETRVEMLSDVLKSSSSEVVRRLERVEDKQVTQWDMAKVVFYVVGVLMTVAIFAPRIVSSFFTAP